MLLYVYVDTIMIVQAAGPPKWKNYQIWHWLNVYPMRYYITMYEYSKSKNRRSNAFVKCNLICTYWCRISLFEKNGGQIHAWLTGLRSYTISTIQQLIVHIYWLFLLTILSSSCLFICLLAYILIAF